MQTILPKYFIHSEYKSFLRQLTSYGFYKKTESTRIGTHCYINIETNIDVQSIMRLKKKKSEKKCRKSIQSPSKKNKHQIKTALQPTLLQMQAYQKVISTCNNNGDTPMLNCSGNQQIQEQYCHEHNISSLLDIENLESRVYCNEEKKLIVDGLLCEGLSSDDIIHSYHVITCARTKNLTLNLSIP